MTIVIALYLILLVAICSNRICNHCGSLLISIKKTKHTGWADEYPEMIFRGLWTFKTRTKICHCCGSGIIRITAETPSQKDLVKMIGDQLAKL